MVEVTPRPNRNGTITFEAIDPKSQGSFMSAIFTPATGELYISSYAVTKALRGRRLSLQLFRNTIQAAADHGGVRVIRGAPAGQNLKALMDPDGTIVPANIFRTPWARVLSDLRYRTILKDGLMESEPS